MRSVSFKTAVMLEIKKKFIWALDEANKISQKVFDEVCNEQKQSQSKQMGNIISKCAGIYNDYVELLINNVFNEWKDSKANSIELIIRFDKENEEAISKENKNIDDIAVSVIEAFSCVNVSLKSSEFPTISSDYYNNCSSYFQKARQQFKELHSSLLTHFQTEAEENLVYYFYGALICCIISQFIAFYDNAVSQFKLIANDVNYQLNSVRADSELIYMQNIIKTANSKIKKAYGLQNEARIAFGSSYNNNQNLNENSNSNEKENSAIFRRFLNSNIRSFNLPKREKWSGTPGNSEFLISDNADVKCNKGQNQCTGRKLKEWMHCNYGTEIIKYNNYDPDFSPFMDKIIGEIDISDCPDDMSLRKFAFNAFVNKKLSHSANKKVSQF